MDKVELINKNHEKKKRDENKGILEKNSTEKKTWKENTKSHSEEKEIPNWEDPEEQKVIASFIAEEYPLMSKHKIKNIINEKKQKYIDIKKYKKFFLMVQSKKMLKNFKKSKKLSNAAPEIQEYFDTEAKETSHTVNKISDDNSEDDEEEEDIEDDEIEEEESITDCKSSTDSDEEENIDKTTGSSVSRKRKCEFSALDEGLPKKKESSCFRVKWLPNGNKVSRVNYFSL